MKNKKLSKRSADLPDEDEIESSPSNVTKEEKKDLQNAAEKTIDEEYMENAALDQIDEDGDLLNERTDLTGSDLDVPGSEDDDANEEIGEEDEENNSYSLGNEDEDDSISKQ